MTEPDDNRTQRCREQTRKARETFRASFASDDDYAAFMASNALKARIVRQRHRLDRLAEQIRAETRAMWESCPHEWVNGSDHCRFCGAPAEEVAA